MEKLKSIIEKIMGRRWLTVVLIFILALGLRAVRPSLVDRIKKDGVLYVYMADDIAKGDMKSAFEQNRRIPPLYLFMMAGLHRMGIPLEASGRLISILAGALLVIPVFLIAEIIFSSRLGAMASFLVAVNPDMVRSSAEVMREQLYLLFLFSAIYFAIKAMKSGNWNLQFWSLAGVCTLLGTAVRTEAVEIIAVILTAIAVELIFLKRAKLELGKTFLKWSAGFILFIAFYYAASIPFSKAIKGSSSTWSIIDNRIPGYFRSLFKISEKDALKKEDTI